MCAKICDRREFRPGNKWRGMKNVCAWQTRVRAYVPMRNKFVHLPCASRSGACRPPNRPQNEIKYDGLRRHYRNTIRDSTGMRAANLYRNTKRVVSPRPITAIHREFRVYVYVCAAQYYIDSHKNINIYSRISVPLYLLLPPRVRYFLFEIITREQKPTVLYLQGKKKFFFSYTVPFRDITLSWAGSNNVDAVATNLRVLTVLRV